MKAVEEAKRPVGGPWPNRAWWCDWLCPQDGRFHDWVHRYRWTRLPGNRNCRFIATKRRSGNSSRPRPCP